MLLPHAVLELIPLEQGSLPLSRLHVPLADGAGKVFSLKENTCIWWFRSPPSSSFPACVSLGRASCSQLPAKPVLLFLAPAPAPAPSLSEPANGEGKKLLLNLWLRNSPAVELQRNGRDSSAGGIAAGGDQMDPTELDWDGDPTSARGMCLWGTSPRVIPSGDVWSSAGHGLAAAPLLRGPFVLRDFHNAVAGAAAQCWDCGEGQIQAYPSLGASVDKVKLLFLWQQVA